MLVAISIGIITSKLMKQLYDLLLRSPHSPSSVLVMVVLMIEMLQTGTDLLNNFVLTKRYVCTKIRPSLSQYKHWDQFESKQALRQV